MPTIAVHATPPHPLQAVWHRAAGYLLLAASLCALPNAARAASSASAQATAPRPAGKATTTPEIVNIPLPPSSAATAPAAMRTLVFKPTGRGPFKVLLFAHGRPAYAKERAKLVHPMSYGHVRYWLGKGYAVVAPIRPGYGPADANAPRNNLHLDPENSGVAYSASGQCLRRPQPERTARAAAAAQRAALDWVRQQPWARANHIVLEGQSVGGLATLALCAANPPGVKGCINFAGGAGGNPLQAPARMCAPEQTTQLMRQLGSSSQPPSIWLYAQNDLYWGADAPKQWHAAFSQAASGAAPTNRSTFVQTPPIGSDGHNLLRAGAKHWGPPMEVWIRQHGL